MDEIFTSLEVHLTDFQRKFKEIEEILYNTHKQFNMLKVEYVKESCNNIMVDRPFLVV